MGIFLHTMLDHATNEIRKILYIDLQNAVLQEYFSKYQAMNISSAIDKLDIICQFKWKQNWYARSFRGDNGNAGRRVTVRSGSISSNHHVTHQTQNDPSFCQKRHSYAFQDDKMVVTKQIIYLESAQQVQPAVKVLL